MATTHQYSDVAIVGTDTLYGLNSIKQSILTLLKTNRGERLFRPEFGSDLENYLWLPMSDSTADSIHTAIKGLIANEYRATLDTLTVTPDYSNYCYNVSLSVLVDGVETQVELQLKKKGL